MYFIEEKNNKIYDHTVKNKVFLFLKLWALSKFYVNFKEI